MLPKSLTISVTQKHIEKGHRHACRKCPIALATIDQLNYEHIAYHDVRVDERTVEIHARGDLYPTCYALPPSAVSLISVFDSYGSAEPLEFTAHREA